MTGAYEVSGVNNMIEVQALIRRIRRNAIENTARAMRVDSPRYAGPTPGTGAAGYLNLLA